MKTVLTADQMRELDQATTKEHDMSPLLLMERAALHLSDFILSTYGKGKRVFILAGDGANGGDGIAAGRILFLKGVEVLIWTRDKSRKLAPLREKEERIAKSYGVPFTTDDKEGRTYDVIVDALFGTGLDRLLSDEDISLVKEINSFPGIRVGVDLPSGVNGTDGRVMGEAVSCQDTVTFSYPKTGLLLYPGRRYTGRLHVRDVGIYLGPEGRDKPGRKVLEKEDIRSFFPYRYPDSNKGSYGKVLCITGSEGMAGASFLSAKAALLAGAGMVKILTTEKNRSILQTLLPEAMVDSYKDTVSPGVVKKDLAWCDQVLIGPGLSTGKTAKDLLSLVFESNSSPMVIDADGINLLAGEKDYLLKPHLDLVLTPHPGEMGRLLSVTTSYVKEHMVSLAEESARDFNATLVLKDATTITAVPFGNTYFNLLGNNGMATAGSGDVLSGLTAGLMAQGLPGEKAGPLAVYLHARAGDIMREKKGTLSLTAESLLEGLPLALKEAEEI